MVGDNREEDIVGRLEALRKKVPPPSTKTPQPKQPKGPEQEPDEKRRKMARIIGVLVILVIISGVGLLGSKFLTKDSGPTETVAPTPPVVDEGPVVEEVDPALIAELADARSNKTKDVEEAFKDVPSGYGQNKEALIKEINTAPTKEEVEVIDIDEALIKTWRQLRNDELSSLTQVTPSVIARIGDGLVKGTDQIQKEINLATLNDLKTMRINEMRPEYIPIRLPRDQITGGFAEVGDTINIHYSWVEKINGTDVPKVKYLAKDGKVISIMRAAGTISLSESESKAQSGGGTEGKGNVTSISSSVGSLGLSSISISISDGPYGASLGAKSVAKQSSYTVNLGEVQKAAAANKISPDVLEENLNKYGIRLSEIERDTNMGDFGAEYLMLVEVTEDEAGEIAMRLLNPSEKSNLLMTISEKPTWAQ